MEPDSDNSLLKLMPTTLDPEAITDQEGDSNNVRQLSSSDISVTSPKPNALDQLQEARELTDTTED